MKGEQWRECSEGTPRETGPRIVAGAGERKRSQGGTRNEIWSSNRNCEVTWEVKHISHRRNISLSQWKALEFAWRSELFIQRKSQPQHIQDKVCTRHMLCELSQGHSISGHFCDSFWFHCDFFFQIPLPQPLIWLWWEIRKPLLQGLWYPKGTTQTFGNSI